MTAIIFFLLTLIPLSAQTGTVSLKMRNATLRQLLTAIEQQTSYHFSYRDAYVDKASRVTVTATREPLKTLLRRELGKRGLSYVMDGDKIVIVPAAKTDDARSAGGQDSPAPQRVSGVVTDASGEPIIGASVFVKGTKNGTVTDMDGRFSLDASPGSTLLISYIGFDSKEVRASEARTVRMTESSESLNEVVVVGYGTQKKVDLTGSVSTVSAKELANRPVSSTAQALAGLAPGLSVITNSGLPGASANVKIRGTGTFSSAGTNPLVLIDGLAGNLDDVDPNDIENISFLKDAASASIYGNRAANGVILVETKRGKEGKTTVSYSGQVGWQKATELPDFLPSWEYATYYNMAMANMGRQNAYTDEQIQKFRDGTDPDNYPNVNHLKWLLDSGNGFQHQHNLSVSGGNSKLTYNVSLGYRKQNGMTAKTYNERMTALLSMKAALTDRLNLSVSLNAYNNRYKAPHDIGSMIGYSVREGPQFAGRKSDGSFGYQDNYSPEAWMASESFVRNIGRNISGSALLVWNTPLQGLSVTGKMGGNYWTSYNKTYNANTYFDDSKTVGPANLNVYSANNTYTDLEGYANYERQLGKHALHVLLGTSLERTKDRDLNGYRNTFPNNYLYELTSGDATTATNSSGLSDYTLISYFGRINYNYADRYLLEANMRYDGSSRFASGHRWGFFPSVSAGWRVSEESFWKESWLSRVFDYFKVRASYGVLGNQNIGVYPYQQTYQLGYDYPFGGELQAGAAMSTYLNQNITWEKTSVTDVGIDFNLLHGALTGTIDYFYKYTSDILAPVEVSSIMGMSVGQSNVGAVSNKGIEVNLTYNGKIGRDFTYSVAPNFTWIKNAVEKLSNGKKEEINNNRIVGEPIGIIYGYQTDGLFVDQAEIDAAPEQLVGKSSLKPGYVRYRDISGPDGVPDGKVDATYDRTVLGSTTPKFYYGLNLTAQYKGVDLSLLFQGLGGHKRLIGSYMAYAFYNGGQIQRWQADHCWTTDNPDKWAEYPRLETLNMNNPNLQVSDYWVRNASFLRLKTLQVGYTFPKRLVKSLGIENLRVYVSGQNLFCINSFYKGWDPENEIGTGDSPNYYPINSIYSFGLNVRF